MLNLTWKIAGQSRSLIEKPFDSHSDLETYIFENRGLLGDINVIYSQKNSKKKHSISANLVGIDKNHRVCYILVCKQPVGEEILPTALMCAESANPATDSFRDIWLESDCKPEDFEIDWDNVKTRVILIAPFFQYTVSEGIKSISRYSIDLVQLHRYYFEDNEFVSVEFIEELPSPRILLWK